MRTNLPITQNAYVFPQDQTLISITDLKGRITYCNPNFAAVSGFTSALGTGWVYEGETMGYRVIYVYETTRDVVATVALNSSAEDPADSAPALIREVIQAALQE